MEGGGRVTSGTVAESSVKAVAGNAKIKIA
jgi:hypothetical protein